MCWSVKSPNLDEDCVGLGTSYQRSFLPQQQSIIFHGAPAGLSWLWLIKWVKVMELTTMRTHQDWIWQTKALPYLSGLSFRTQRPVWGPWPDSSYMNITEHFFVIHISAQSSSWMFSLEVVFLYLSLSVLNVYLLIWHYDFDSIKYQDFIKNFFFKIYSLTALEKFIFTMMRIFLSWLFYCKTLIFLGLQVVQ